MDDFLLMTLAMEDEEMEAKDELGELHFEDDEDEFCEDPLFPVWIDEEDHRIWLQELYYDKHGYVEEMEEE